MNKKFQIIIPIFLLILIGTGFYYISINKSGKQTKITTENSTSNVSTKVVNLVSDVREKPERDSEYILTSDNIEVGTDRGDNIYLRFDNAINGNESLENFKKYLQPENTVVNISLPELAVKGADEIPTISESDQAVRDNMKITFLSYEKGRLKGILTTKASEADYWVRDNDDPKCITDDMMGICVKTIPLNMDLTINFEVQVK